MLCRGVGCIFVEMIQGVAAFPGMKDIQDQLERIFLVSGLCVYVSVAALSLHVLNKNVRVKALLNEWKLPSKKSWKIMMIQSLETHA